MLAFTIAALAYESTCGPARNGRRMLCCGYLFLCGLGAALEKTNDGSAHVGALDFDTGRSDSGADMALFRPEPRAAELAPKAETAVAQPASSTMGFFASAFARLYDTPELRRKYLFDFLAPTNSRFAFYVSPSDLFIFSVWDVNGEQYTLEVPIAADTIPLSCSYLPLLRIGPL